MSNHGDKQIKIVTKKRPVFYSPVRVEGFGKLVIDTNMKISSTGWEIEKEVNSCEKHATQA